jgi:hypothetical protein
MLRGDSRRYGLIVYHLRKLDFLEASRYVRVAMENEDIEAVLKAAKDIRTKYRHGLLNPLSSLPEPKVKIKVAIKERVRHLVGAYIALAGFVDDDDIQFAERHPKSKRTKAIYLKVIEDMEVAQKEMHHFRLYN